MPKSRCVSAISRPRSLSRSRRSRTTWQSFARPVSSRSPNRASGPSTRSRATFPPRRAAFSTLSGSDSLARRLIGALGPLGDELPRPLFLKTEATRLAHATRSLGVSEQGEDRASDRVWLLCDDEAIDAVAHHLPERRDVARDHRPPGVPGLEVRVPERFVDRRHREDRRARVGLGLLRLAHDSAVDPAVVLEASLEARGPRVLSDRHEPRLGTGPPHDLRRVAERVVPLVPLF